MAADFGQQQPQAGFPLSQESAVKFAASVKRRAAVRAELTVAKIKTFGKRDKVTCSTPVGTMRVRNLLHESGVKVKDDSKTKLRGR